LRYHALLWGSFSFLVLFFYYLIQSTLGIYPGNFLLALAGCSVLFRGLGWDLVLFLFFLGWINGLDSGLEFQTALYFASIAFVFVKLRDYFKFERFKVKLGWWVGIIIGYLIFRLIFYFYTLQIDTPFDLEAVLNLFVKTNVYFLTTLIDSLLFYGILKLVLSEK